MTNSNFTLKKNRMLTLLALMFTFAGIYAQKTTISYTTPNNFKMGAAISPLSPTNAGGASSFNYPQGVAVYASGKVFVADETDNKIRKISLNNYSLSPNLPVGLNFNGNTGVISGTPTTETLTGDYKIKAYNASGIDSIIVKITVKPTVAAPPTGFSYSGIPAMATRDNTEINATPVVSGNVLQYAISPDLPVGLSFNTTTGVIKGVPSEILGNYMDIGIFRGSTINYTVTATNTSGSVSTNFALTVVVPKAPSISYSNPSTYILGTAISDLTPTNTGGDVQKSFPGMVSTVAGDVHISGSTDGNALGSWLNSPTSVAVDAAGNVFVADYKNNKIKKITPSGVVSTFAGSGAAGSTDGTGIAASFNGPKGLAIDRFDMLYVADEGNNKIRKITPAGVVSTYSGTGALGSNDASNTYATFYHPQALAINYNLQICVTQSNNKIRVIPNGGNVYTIDGSGMYGGGTWSTDSLSLGGIAIDNTGFIYISDYTKNKIRKISPSGDLTTLAGTGVAGQNNGPKASATFDKPMGLVLNATGDIYVANYNQNVIRKITAAGMVSNYIGNSSGFNDSPLDVDFNGPYGVAIDAAGNIYVADYNNHAVRKINLSKETITIAGSGSPGDNDLLIPSASFNMPYGLAVDDSTNIFVADAGNNKIRKITPSGIVSTFAGSGDGGYTDGIGAFASFSAPKGVAFDKSHNLFVVDADNNLIRKITPAGEVSTFAGSGNSGSANGTGTAASFNSPFGIAIDTSNNLYITDQANNMVRKITPTGEVSTLAGSTTAGSTNGIGSAASFDSPYGVAVDAQGNIYVSDANNLRKIAPAGDVTTFVSGLNSCIGITVDPNGYLYLGSVLGYIYRVSPSGTLEVIVTSKYMTQITGSTNIDGSASNASFYTPVGMSMDASSNLYIGDLLNNNIRKMSVGPYSISPSLPAGLSFDGLTGKISGTPKVASPATLYTINAYNTAGSSSTSVNLVVNDISTSTANSTAIQSSFKAYSINNKIKLIGSENANIMVFNQLGQQVFVGKANNEIINYSFAKGLYIVKVDNTARKVIVN